MKAQYTCIIPARYESSRFPGKPLHKINGKPMILWVAENATRAKRTGKIIVATDSQEIFDIVTEAGFNAQLTSKECPNGSARVAEVARNVDDEWVFEMQGDQPLVTPEVVDEFISSAEAELEKDNAIEVVIPFAKTTAEQTQSPDVLKVVVTQKHRLVFQTRQPIHSGYRTLGLYMWNNKALQKFSALPVSSIEESEDSHPIRLYVNDFVVQGVEVDGTNWIEVDRINHIEEVENLLTNEPAYRV